MSTDREGHRLQLLRPVWSGMTDNETFPQIGRFKHPKVTPILAPVFGLYLAGFVPAARDDQIL